jgi:hypothetical protein
MCLFCLFCFPISRIHGIPAQAIRNLIQHLHSHHLNLLNIANIPAHLLAVWNAPLLLTQNWLLVNANVIFALLIVNVDYSVGGCEDDDYLNFAVSKTPMNLDWTHLLDLGGDSYTCLSETADFLSLSNEDFLEMLEKDGRYEHF